MRVALRVIDSPAAEVVASERVMLFGEPIIAAFLPLDQYLVQALRLTPLSLRF